MNVSGLFSILWPHSRRISISLIGKVWRMLWKPLWLQPDWCESHKLNTSGFYCIEVSLALTYTCSVQRCILSFVPSQLEKTHTPSSLLTNWKVLTSGTCVCISGLGGEFMSAISYSIRGQLSWHKRMYAFRYVLSYQYIVAENIGINALTLTTHNCVVW